MKSGQLVRREQVQLKPKQLLNGGGLVDPSKTGLSSEESHFFDFFLNATSFHHSGSFYNPFWDVLGMIWAPNMY